jgi:ribonuclease HII
MQKPIEGLLATILRAIKRGEVRQTRATEDSKARTNNMKTLNVQTVIAQKTNNRCLTRKEQFEPVLVAGVDEAGRGCVIGPLVIAGVLIKEESLPVLKQLGVKDSKLLSPKKRESLALEIIRIAEKHLVVKLSPAEIDHAVDSGRKLHKLNRLEAETMAQIINTLKPDEAFVDAADVLEDRFKHHIQERLTTKTALTSKHKADKIYPAVSAASIIAKVNRDREIAAIATQHGDFGSGYLTDPKTMTFLKQWLKTNGDYPDFVRKSWKPAKKAKNENGAIQKTLA